MTKSSWKDVGFKLEVFPFNWILDYGRANNMIFPCNNRYVSVGPFTLVVFW